MNIIDFESLVKNCPIQLNSNSKTKFTKILQENFKDDEMKWFVVNLYCHTHFDGNDLPIDLDNVYKIIGYANKGNAKKTLENNFIENVDYRIDNATNLLVDSQKQHGGTNKEIVMLTIETFKILCMLAKTDKGNQVRKYYLKLESIFSSLIQEERLEFEKELLEKDKLIASQALEIKKKDEKIKDSRIDQDMYYYVLGSKLGICHNPDDTLRTYRRLSTKTSFDWLYKFNLPKNAKDIETIIKNILFNFREKVNKDTEVFDLPQEKCLELVQSIIAIFDNPNSSKFKQIDDLINALSKKTDDNTHENSIKIKLLETEFEKIKQTKIPDEFFYDPDFIPSRDIEQDIKNNIIVYKKGSFLSVRLLKEIYGSIFDSRSHDLSFFTKIHPDCISIKNNIQICKFCLHKHHGGLVKCCEQYTNGAKSNTGYVVLNLAVVFDTKKFLHEKRNGKNLDVVDPPEPPFVKETPLQIPNHKIQMELHKEKTPMQIQFDKEKDRDYLFRNMKF